MSINTLHGTAAPYKPSTFDGWYAGWVLAAIQDEKDLRGLPPAERDRTTKALKDLDVILHSPSWRERDGARERLAQALAAHFWRVIDPEVWRALKEHVHLTGKYTENVKLEAMRVGLFLALPELSRVQKVQLGQTRDTVVVDDGVLVLCTSDGGVRDWAAGLAHEGRFEKLLRPRSAVMAAFLGYDSWMKDAKDCVWAACVGPTRPVDLRAGRRLDWLRCRAIRYAEEWVVDGQLSANSRVRDRTDLDLEDQFPNPLDALVATEELVERLGEVYSVATPKQRQILDVLDELLASGLEIPDAKRLTAEKLGIQVGAIDTAMSRLRTRVGAADRL